MVESKEIEQLRSEFSYLDMKKNGFITVENLKCAFDRMGVQVCVEDLEYVVQNIDSSGRVRFSQFLALNFT